MEQENGKTVVQRPMKRSTLAEELANTLTEEIVEGARPPGQALPTEVELSSEFGVSRSVVRDATRLLAARGLVDVRHGRGAFVTESQLDSFKEALLLALRREKASVWDVEEFFGMLWPDAFAMAAERATPEDLNEIRDSADIYLSRFATVHRISTESTDQHREKATEDLRDSFRLLLKTILVATHNKVFALFATPFTAMQSFRNWKEEQSGTEELVELETRSIMDVIDAIIAKDPASTRRAVATWFDLPAEAREAMRSTPIGEGPRIPMSLSDYVNRRRR